MPQKRQRPLPFQRTIIPRATRSNTPSANQSSAPSSQNGTPAPSEASTSAPPLAASTLTPTPRSPAPPLPERKKNLRNSWVFNHMPDIDIQTKYHNENTNVEEWRCRYCTKVYALSGGTGAPGRHLEEYYNIPRESPRDIAVKNIQKSLAEAFAQAEAHPQKRRRIDMETVSQDKLESL